MTIHHVTSSRFKEQAHAALGDAVLQGNLTRMRGNFLPRRAKVRDGLPEFDALRDAGIAIKQHTIAHLDLYLEAFEAAVTAKSLGLLAPADKSAQAGYGSFEAMVDTLESAVAEGPYILGDRFSAADVYVGSQIIWGLMFKTLPERPAFQAYAGRLSSRPAAVRAREIDDALIAAAAKTD